MAIDGIFYKNDIKAALRGGALKVSQIKAKLVTKNIKLDETQILDVLESMIKNRVVVRSDGKFALATVL